MSTMRGSRGVLQVLLLGSTTLGMACGGAPAPAKSAPSGVEGTPVMVQNPVSKPAELDAVRVHLARPRRDLPVVGGLLATPPYSDVLANPESMLPVLVGGNAARVIDANGPIDGAIGYDVPVTGAVAFRVRPSEAGNLRGRELPGRLRLAKDDARLGSCELWRKRELRLICAQNEAALDRFAPALADVTPPTSDASLVIESSGPTYEARLREALAKQAAKAEANENSAERTGREIAQELMLHQKLTVELGLTPRGIEVAVTLGYTSKRESPLLQAWFEGGLSPKPLPTPHSGGSFAFAYAGSEVFAKLASAGLDHFMADMAETSTATAQDLKDTRTILEQLVPTNGRIALTSGSDPSAALALLEKPAPTAAQRRKLDRALGSWWVATLETPPAPYLEALERASKLDERKIKDKVAPGKAAEKVRPTSSKLSQSKAVPKQLPPGTLHFLDTVTPNKDFKPDSEHPAEDARVNHILVVPDSERSRVLIAVSRSEEVAASQARVALDSSAVVAPAPGPLLAMRVTPAGILSMDASFDSAEDTAKTKAALQQLEGLPSKGQQVLGLTGTIRRPAGSSDGLELQIAMEMTTASAMEWLKWASGGMGRPRN